jgi:hypothetical protein
MVRYTALTACFLFGLSSAALAEPRADCATLAQRVQDATKSKKLQTSDNAITFEMPLPKAGAVINELQIVCPEFAKGPNGYSVVATWAHGSAPTDAYFRQVAAAGAALTGEEATKIDRAARTCTDAAARTQLSSSEIEAGKVYLNCQSLQRLDGPTTISIYHRGPSSAAK